MIYQWYIDDISMIWLTRSVLIVRFLEKLNNVNSPDPITWLIRLLFLTHTIGLSDSHDSFLKRVTHVICFRSETAWRVAWPRIDANLSWAKRRSYCKVSVVTSQYCDMTDLIRLLWDPLIRNDVLILAITGFSNKTLGKKHVHWYSSAHCFWNACMYQRYIAHTASITVHIFPVHIFAP